MVYFLNVFPLTYFMQFSNKQVYKFCSELWHSFIAYFFPFYASRFQDLFFFVKHTLINAYLDQVILFFSSSGTDAQHPAPDKFILIYY